jgi:hypothetical protein
MEQRMEEAAMELQAARRSVDVDGTDTPAFDHVFAYEAGRCRFEPVLKPVLKAPDFRT